MTSLPPSRRLGGPIARRALHVIYVLDRSGSMNADGKIQALNTAITESAALLRSAAEDHLTAEILVRAAVFSDGAAWHIEEPVPAERFRWSPITAEGLTDLGAALSLVAAGLGRETMPDRSMPPVIVLVSDGQPTDDHREGLRRLLATPWGPLSLRLAIAIGRDADLDVLQEFMGYDSPYRPIQAEDPESILAAVDWATAAASRLANGTITAGPSSRPDVFVLDEDRR